MMILSFVIIISRTKYHLRTADSLTGSNKTLILTQKSVKNLRNFPQKIEMLRMKQIQTKRFPATVHVCEMGCEQRGLLAAACTAAGADGGEVTDG